MNLENIPELEQYIACELLKVTIEDNDKYHIVTGSIFDSDRLNQVCFTDTMLQNKSVIDLVQILGYSSNEIADWFVDYLKESNVVSPMIEEETLYTAIWNFLDKVVGVVL